jgi:hypothetical protein
MESSPAQLRRSDRFKRLQATLFECIVFEKSIIQTAAEHRINSWSLQRCATAIRTGRVENIRATMPEIEIVDQSDDEDMPDLIPSTGSDRSTAIDSQTLPDAPLLGFINNLRRHLELQQQRDLGDSGSQDPDWDSDSDTPEFVRLLYIDRFKF